MELASTDANPIPYDPVCDMATTQDDVELRYARWRTQQPNCRGTVILLQGRGEYIEKYFETISDLVSSGFDVCTFDWRGQGGSQRLLNDSNRGYVDSFDQYVTDLDAVLDQVVLPDCRPPYTILAHSTGCLIALLAAPALGNRVQRMVLSSPLVHFGKMPISQNALKFMAGMLTVIGLGKLYMAGGRDLNAKRQFTGNVLTSDTRRFERNTEFAKRHGDRVIGGATATWLFAACRAMDQLADPDFIGSIHIPSLLVVAGNDEVVSNTAIDELGYAMRSGRTILIPGARHEIMQERDVYRQQLFAAFDSFAASD